MLAVQRPLTAVASVCRNAYQNMAAPEPLFRPPPPGALPQSRRFVSCIGAAVMPCATVPGVTTPEEPGHVLTW